MYTELKGVNIIDQYKNVAKIEEREYTLQKIEESVRQI